MTVCRLDEVACGVEMVFGVIEELQNRVQVLPLLILMREIQFRTVLDGNAVCIRDDPYQWAFGVGLVLRRLNHDGQGS